MLKLNCVLINLPFYLIFKGTGAACVYPFLGSKKFGWNFVATETDPLSFESAKKNVTENELDKKILIKQV